MNLDFTNSFTKNYNTNLFNEKEEVSNFSWISHIQSLTLQQIFLFFAVFCIFYFIDYLNFFNMMSGLMTPSLVQVAQVSTSHPTKKKSKR